MEKLNGHDIVECLPEDSWLRDWMEVWPTAEAPKSYILFAGMMMLGAALGRKVWFRKEDFRNLWPMLNLLLIGPSGVGKSTSIYMAKGLLENVPIIERPQFIVGGATPEALHKDLLPNPHAVLFASELANFFNQQKYMVGMIPYVTELLDYAPVEKRTIHGGLIRIEEPSVTVVGGSTVDWLQGQLPDSATSGGFLARFLIVSEEHRGQRVACPANALSKRQQIELERRRAEVFDEFVDCLHTHAGEVSYQDFSAMDAYSLWYSAHEPETGHLAPFAARAGEFVLRLAMLLAISSQRNAVSADDIEAAIQLYNYCEGKLQEVVVPYSQKGKLLAEVLKAVGDGATDVQIRQAMRNFCTSQETDQMLVSLMASKDVVRTPGGLYVRLKKGA